MPGWFKNWWNRTMVMDMTQHCNDGSWESGFYDPEGDDAGIRSVESLEHELTIVQADMNNVSYNLVSALDQRMLNKLRDLPTEDHGPIHRSK